jgi:hypothetical protein
VGSGVKVAVPVLVAVAISAASGLLVAWEQPARKIARVTAQNLKSKRMEKIIARQNLEPF